MNGLRSLASACLASFCLVGAFLVAACAGPNADPPQPRPTSPSPAPSHPAPPWPSDITVPELRTVGDLPPAVRRVIVGLDADGRLSVDGDDATMEHLRRVLRERTSPAASGSNTDVLLALDRTLPWGAAARVVTECAIAGVDRLFFAAEPASGGAPGAIALFLPSDSDLAPPGDRPAVQVFVREGWPPTDVLGLHDVIRGMSHESGIAVTIDADRSAPMGVLLRIADVAALEGASTVSFAALGLPPLPPGEMLEEVAELRTQPPARRLIVFDEELAGPSLLIPNAERVVGGYAGFFRP